MCREATKIKKIIERLFRNDGIQGLADNLLTKSAAPESVTGLPVPLVNERHRLLVEDAWLSTWAIEERGIKKVSVVFGGAHRPRRRAQRMASDRGPQARL